MKLLIFLFVVVSFVAETEASTAMSCGNRLVSTGMTKLDVISNCGQPDLKEFVSLNTVGVDLGRAFRASTSGGTRAEILTVSATRRRGPTTCCE